VALFSAHGDVVVGFAIFHIFLFQKEKRKKERKKKGTACCGTVDVNHRLVGNPKRKV
jgi:hypothetical protein